MLCVFHVSINLTHWTTTHSGGLKWNAAEFQHARESQMQQNNREISYWPFEVAADTRTIEAIHVYSVCVCVRINKRPCERVSCKVQRE